MPTLREGDPAPDFERTLADGRTFRLSAERSRVVVLYFYPKDDSLGCTLEAQSFRDAHPEFVRLGATIVGVSPDVAACHVAFAGRHRLPFGLISDPQGDLAKAYGVRKTLGVIPGRATFVIDTLGIVRLAFVSLVRVHEHATRALAVVEKLRAYSAAEEPWPTSEAPSGPWPDTSPGSNPKGLPRSS